MGKIIITSLFTYDPLISILSDKQSVSDNEEKSQFIDIDFNTILVENLSKIIIREMVQSVMLCAVKKELDHLVFVMDKSISHLQDEALKIIKERLKDTVKFEEIKVDGNDTISVAREVVKFIDDGGFDKSSDEIYVNISSLRHEKTLGMIFAAYARSDVVREIMYVNKEDRRVMKIPMLSLYLTEKQRRVLDYLKQIHEKRIQPVKKVHTQVGIERSSYYEIKKTLRNKGLLDDKENITEMGEIALL